MTIDFVINMQCFFRIWLIVTHFFWLMVLTTPPTFQRFFSDLEMLHLLENISPYKKKWINKTPCFWLFSESQKVIFFFHFFFFKTRQLNKWRNTLSTTGGFRDSPTKKSGVWMIWHGLSWFKRWSWDWIQTLEICLKFYMVEFCHLDEFYLTWRD